LSFAGVAPRTYGLGIINANRTARGRAIHRVSVQERLFIRLTAAKDLKEVLV
jgi:hypothetical protein